MRADQFHNALAIVVEGYGAALAEQDRELKRVNGLVDRLTKTTMEQEAVIAMLKTDLAKAKSSTPPVREIET